MPASTLIRSHHIGDPSDVESCPPCRSARDIACRAARACRQAYGDASEAHRATIEATAALSDARMEHLVLSRSGQLVSQ